MKNVSVIRHVHFENLGTLEPLLKQRGYGVQYFDAWTRCDPDEIQKADLLVVLGAPIGAFDDAVYPFLTHEVELLERRLVAQAPLLGICLGAQLMVRALGGHVAPMVRKEIGFSPVELTAAGLASPLAGLPMETAVLHWHGDQFEIPSGTVSLARTDICPHQAFALGNYALGLQFHLEADAEDIEPWLVGHASELAQAGISPSGLRAQAAIHGVKLKAAAQAVFSLWLDGF